MIKPVKAPKAFVVILCSFIVPIFIMTGRNFFKRNDLSIDDHNQLIMITFIATATGTLAGNMVSIMNIATNVNDC